jgi:hypothetical protein
MSIQDDGTTMTILKKTNTCEEQFMKKKRSVFRTRARTQKGSGQPENPEPLNGILYKTNYYYFNSQNPTIWSELVVVGPTKAAFFHMAEGSLAPSSPWLAWQLPLVSMHVLSLSLSLTHTHTHTHTHTSCYPNKKACISLNVTERMFSCICLFLEWWW